MLAWNYGYPRVMSSYYFSSSDQGPPHVENDVYQVRWHWFWRTTFAPHSVMLHLIIVPNIACILFHLHEAPLASRSRITSHVFCGTFLSGSSVLKFAQNFTLIIAFVFVLSLIYTLTGLILFFYGTPVTFHFRLNPRNLIAHIKHVKHHPAGCVSIVGKRSVAWRYSAIMSWIQRRQFSTLRTSFLHFHVTAKAFSPQTMATVRGARELHIE